MCNNNYSPSFPNVKLLSKNGSVMYVKSINLTSDYLKVKKDEGGFIRLLMSKCVKKTIY